jgi:hypothetical protein
VAIADGQGSGISHLRIALLTGRGAVVGPNRSACRAPDLSHDVMSGRWCRPRSDSARTSPAASRPDRSPSPDAVLQGRRARILIGIATRCSRRRFRDAGGAARCPLQPGNGVARLGLSKPAGLTKPAFSSTRFDKHSASQPSRRVQHQRESVSAAQATYREHNKTDILRECRLVGRTLHHANHPIIVTGDPLWGRFTSSSRIRAMPRESR